MPLGPTAGVCEDDDEVRGVLRQALERDGFSVRATASGAEAVRARAIAAPVLFLTARDTVPDRISGFNAGGDDYLTKPFALAELVVRARALLRRTRKAEPAAAGVLLDPAAHALVRDGTRVSLTPTEFRVLAALAASPGAVLRRSALVAAAWPDGAIVHDNTLDAYLARIRRKLREAGAPQAIETVRGVGYVLR